MSERKIIDYDALKIYDQNIKDFVSIEVKALEDKINEGGASVEIDATLTKEGAAADAKVVGDTLNIHDGIIVEVQEAVSDHEERIATLEENGGGSSGSESGLSEEYFTEKNIYFKDKALGVVGEYFDTEDPDVGVIELDKVELNPNGMLRTNAGGIETQYKFNEEFVDELEDPSELTIATEQWAKENMLTKEGDVVSLPDSGALSFDDSSAITSYTHKRINYNNAGDDSNYFLPTDEVGDFVLATREWAQENIGSGGDSSAEIEALQTEINNIKNGGTLVHNATNAKKVNNLEIKADANGVLKIGDIIIPQKKLLWSGSVAPSRVNENTKICDASISANKKIEVELANGFTVRFKTFADIVTDTYSNTTSNDVGAAFYHFYNNETLGLGVIARKQNDYVGTSFPNIVAVYEVIE